MRVRERRGCGWVASKGLPPSPRLGLRTGYVLAYNLLQFCGHSWVLANILARALRFGSGRTGSGAAARLLPCFSASLPAPQTPWRTPSTRWA